MKNKFIYILILILIFILLITIFSLYVFNSIEPMNDESPPIYIGNYTCRYFYDLGKSIYEKKDFNRDNEHSNLEFIKHLPTFLPYNYDNIREQFIKDGIDDSWFDHTVDGFPNIYGSWEMKNLKTEKFWLAMKHLIHEIMDEAFIKSNLVKTVEYPVLHFRCADTPFSKWSGYLFQKYNFYKDALDEITTRVKKFDTVIISYCNTHRSDTASRNSCDVYIKSLVDYLESIGYKSKLECNHYLDDFATIFYAPAVISTGSSFSFMSGFFGKGVFISGGHEFYDDPKDYEYLQQIGNWLYKGYNLPHSSVDDYHDTDKVIKMLS